MGKNTEKIPVNEWDNWMILWGYVGLAIIAMWVFLNQNDYQAF